MTKKIDYSSITEYISKCMRFKKPMQAYLDKEYLSSCGRITVYDEDASTVFVGNSDNTISIYTAKLNPITVDIAESQMLEFKLLILQVKEYSENMVIDKITNYIMNSNYDVIL